MRRRAAILLLFLSAAVVAAASPSASLGTGGAVAAEEELAARVGIDVLRRGGTATDAAVAVAFALAVTWPEAGNIGGGGFWISRDASRRVLAIDFRERAPRAARRDMFARGERPGASPPSSTEGALASGVPGSVAGLALAHRRGGRLPWKTLVEPAIVLARDGFVVTDNIHESIAADRSRLAADPETAAIFLPGGEAPAPGSRLRQPALARTLQTIAERGEDGFYRGRVARAIEEGQKRSGGLLTRGDLALYAARVRPAVSFRLAGADVFTTAAPSSGPALAQMALVAEAVGLDRLRPRDADSAHWIAEIEKRAYYDRNRLLGDPDFGGVRQSHFTSADAARRLAATIDPAHATPTTALAALERPDASTTHFSVADARGNVVSVTTTLNDSFGNARVAPGLGFLWNNEMDDFSTRPGEPNLFGLVQGDVNAVAPGKRMLSAMCPVLVSIPGRGTFAWGTPGGSTILTTNFQVLLGLVIRREPLAEAVGMARFHQQDFPDVVEYEKDAFDAAWIAALERKGHATKVERPRARARKDRTRPRRRVAPRRTDRGGGRHAAPRRRPGRAAGTVTVTDEFRPLYRVGRVLRLLDQRLLPAQEVWLELSTAPEIALAIRDMAVRGAPAIGVAAAYGAAFSMRSGRTTPAAQRFETARTLLASTRPTAVNLFEALARLAARFAEVRDSPADAIESALVAEADAVAAEDLESCRRIGRFGAALLPAAATVLTHCNAGALATAGYGTALGVVRAAAASGRGVRVLAGETRPFLQGARLTAWELAREGIPVELMTDNMGGHYLSRGGIDAVIVGADRIAANGDTANKIGTYSLAVLAKENGVPFYVAAPMTTVDFACPTGEGIPIEERPAAEVLQFAGHPIAPAGVAARGAAFDVTPARYVTAIVTDQGVCAPPFGESLRAAAERALARP